MYVIDEFLAMCPMSIDKLKELCLCQPRLDYHLFNKATRTLKISGGLMIICEDIKDI
jgi:hypothetical protein